MLNVFTVTLDQFDVSLLNRSSNFFKKIILLTLNFLTVRNLDKIV